MLGLKLQSSPVAAVSSQTTPMKKYAVVTGGNKGIGFEICRQLASEGISVLLTARNETRGLEAVEKLKKTDHSVTFHQLDVVDSQSVCALAEYVKHQAHADNLSTRPKRQVQRPKHLLDYVVK